MKPIDYAAPKTLAQAVTLLAKHGERARVLAGGTDILVQLREGRRDCDVLVDIKNIKQLNELTCNPKGKTPDLRIGAAVPCYRIYEHKNVRKFYPGLIDAVELVGGIQIQSRASLGGNLCNASPAADTIPALIALQAVCEIIGPNGNREVPVEQFCVGPGRNSLQPGELLVAFRMPPPAARTGAHYQRFIPRNEMDIAVVGVGAWVTLDEAKTRCTAARLALAAVAPTPLLVTEAAAALVDGEINDALIDQAAELAQAAAKPISDMRGDADYRKHLVRVLTKRVLHTAIERAKEN
ncbi:MAG: xanthine dehydrogenase family protein subunit M [Planctomycetia bacterium]|nr:xanthine dehydrogenase family protein subunit M [Planctomycetia bacterium]